MSKAIFFNLSEIFLMAVIICGVTYAVCSLVPGGEIHTVVCSTDYLLHSSECFIFYF